MADFLSLQRLQDNSCGGKTKCSFPAQFAAPIFSRYSGSPAGVDQGTIAKWLFHQEKATLNDVRNGS
jgi:hypothetical protein